MTHFEFGQTAKKHCLAQFRGCQITKNWAWFSRVIQDIPKQNKKKSSLWQVFGHQDYWLAIKNCCKMHFWSLQICMDNTKSKKLPNSIFLIPFSQVFNKTSKHEFDLLRHKNTIQRYHVLLQKLITQSILQSSNSNFTMT